MASNHRQQHRSNASLPRKSTVKSPGATPTTTARTQTSTSPSAHEQPYSSDPFAPNYRHICPWSEEEKADLIATWSLPLRADYWQVYESVEHAEFTRPMDQLRVLLRRHGWEDKYLRIIRGGSDDGVESEGGKTHPSGADPEDFYEKLRKLLREAGEEEGGGVVAGEGRGDSAKGEVEVAGSVGEDCGGEVVGGGRYGGV